jgi:hypothetical protein
MKKESDYISGKGVAQPLIFRRKEKDIPDLKTYYFFYNSDSTIHQILYEWDDNNFKRKEKNIKSPAEIKAFIEKYKALYSQIAERYGISESEGDLNDLSKIETGDFRKKDTWKTKDSTEIQLYTVLSSKYKRTGDITITPTYRIRLYINDDKKKQEQTVKLDEKKVSERDKTFQTFLSDLASKDLAKAKLSLSDVILNQVSNQQLEGLSQNIRFNEEMDLHLSGSQVGLDGTIFLMLQYKYKADISTPPKEVVKVLFDQKAKIIGIQPLKRQ